MPELFSGLRKLWELLANRIVPFFWADHPVSDVGERVVVLAVLIRP